MSFELASPAIRAHSLSKRYVLYGKPFDRLKQFFRPNARYGREFWAVQDIDFSVGQGEVFGLVGQNGAGKSTVLQLICGTLTPTGGSVSVTGRVSALLELGAGFNPEFTGRENVFLAASILGLSIEETEDRFESIVDFSGIRDFIDNPVKTYSSGMYVRLAFSVAINVDPDILVIDEALSVGDGEFARRSFDRIMEFKKAGKTILFCSHSLYQVEAICDRAIWLDHGRVRVIGDAQTVVRHYNDYLNHDSQSAVPIRLAEVDQPSVSAPSGPTAARLLSVDVSVDSRSGKVLIAESGKSDVVINVGFSSNPSLPAPNIAAGFMWPDGRIVCSASTFFDKVPVERSVSGSGQARLTFPRLPLLKGQYWVAVYLFCENGIHVYDNTDTAAEVTVTQSSLEQGVVSLPHFWN
jgi:lipopolysaccharide transport system ATP-binding protein